MEALAMVSSDGSIFWPPIVKLRSTCFIDITYYPFDDQICKMKMGSWAYDGFQVDVFNSEKGIDLTELLILPIRGTKFDVAGIFSAMSSINTENASNTVNPKVTFSPLSGLIQNPSKRIGPVQNVHHYHLIECNLLSL
jgi:hypothetical protein